MKMISVRGEKGEKIMSDYKETAVVIVSKEYFDHLREDIGFAENIVKRISSELAERIMGILEREEEIIVRQSDLRASEFMPTNSVEYRRQINWSPLVRCKDCEFYEAKEKWCGRLGLCGAFDPNDFCSHGERREDGKTD